MLHNYHAHTKRCNHAVGEDREYIEKAIEGGLKTLGMSDHAPYRFTGTDYVSGFRMREDELFNYANSIRALAKEYEKDIRILCGFELEYYPKFHAEEREFLSQIKPDYCILGQHALYNEIEHIFSKQQEDAFLEQYVTQALEGLATGDFLYLAHPDMSGYSYSKEARLREYRRLCEGAKRMNIPLEINLLGIRSKRYYPNREFFEIAASVGNAVVLGTDAHEPRHVIDLESEEIALKMVKELNLNLIETPLL